MDPLSDVLSMLRVTSFLSTRFEGRGRWAFRFPEYPFLIKFGAVLEGRFQLALTGARSSTKLEAGDFYLLTSGRPFCSASEEGIAAIDGPLAYNAHRGADGVVRFGTEGPLLSLASGRFTLDADANRLLLRHLPPIIHLRAADPGSKPLAGLLDMLRWELSETRPGALVARANLAGLVLVQALRVFLDNVPQPEGWLGAMADRRLGAALSSMHGDIAHPWTVGSLAIVAGMSRTAFALRFKQLAGATPLDYLNEWRMTVARKALTSGDQTIAEIAQQVGYRSHTSFSSAFKRATGESPGRYREVCSAPDGSTSAPAVHPA